MAKSFLLHKKIRGLRLHLTLDLCYRLPLLWMRFWSSELGNWKQLDVMLALCALGYSRWHSLAMQVSLVLGGELFEHCNASNRCTLLLSHSKLFFNLFFLPSQLNRFPNLGISGVAICLFHLSLAIGAQLSMIMFCFSPLVQTGMQFSPYIWGSTSYRGVLNRLSVI